MIIDMTVMDVVQAPIVDIVHVIAVPDHHVRIAVAMHVIRVQGRVERGFIGGVFCGHVEDMLIDMIGVHKVEVAIMQVIPVIDMPDLGVTAAIAMHMRVCGVNVAAMRVRCHGAARQTRCKES